MNGSLPPISRFTRATRSAHATATRLPVSTEPVKATQSTRSSRTIASPTSPAPASRFTTPGGRWSKQRRQHQRRERRQLGGLADRRVAGRQRGRELPGQQQQRVVPRHDAADHAHRLLQHERELRRLDRRDHAAGAVAPDLGVVVERGRGPADLVGVLDQRLAALERHRPGQLVGAARAGASRPRAASRRARPRASPPRRAPPRGPRRSRRRPARRRAARRSRASPPYRGSRPSSGAPVAGDLLAADQQPGLELAQARSHVVVDLDVADQRAVHRALAGDHAAAAPPARR